MPSAPAMGSVKQALGGNDLFYSVGVLLSDGVIAEFFLFPPNPLDGWWGFEGRGASQLSSGFSFWSVSSWFFRESIVFSLGQPAIRRRFRKNRTPAL